MDCAVADSRTNEIVAPLTAAQREAVCHRDGPLLILAGPGSGKTRVVTHRIAFLLSQSIPAQQIVALTFTNKAAEEMRARLERLAPGQAVWVGTFHRFCARLLRRHARLVGLEENFTILDAEDSRKLLNQVLASAGLKSDYVTPATLRRRSAGQKTTCSRPTNSYLRPVSRAARWCSRRTRPISGGCWRPTRLTSTTCCCTPRSYCVKTPTCVACWMNATATSW